MAVHYYRDHEAAADTLAHIRELGSDGVIVQEMSRGSRIFGEFSRQRCHVDV